MNFLQTLLGKVRGVDHAVFRGVQGGVQAINPWDAESKGNNLINAANQNYRFTPLFKANLDKANPQVIKRGSDDGLFDATGHTNAISINVRNGYNTSPADAQDTLLHEGLHRIWQYNPQERARFITAYSKGATPDLRSYLVDNLSSYPEYNKIPEDALMNINKLPVDLQNEAHSFIPGYYNSKHIPLPPALRDYYSQYYGARQPAPDNGVLASVKRLLGHL